MLGQVIQANVDAIRVVVGDDFAPMASKYPVRVTSDRYPTNNG